MGQRSTTALTAGMRVHMHFGRRDVLRLSGRPVFRNHTARRASSGRLVFFPRARSACTRSATPPEEPPVLAISPGAFRTSSLTRRRYAWSATRIRSRAPREGGDPGIITASRSRSSRRNSGLGFAVRRTSSGVTRRGAFADASIAPELGDVLTEDLTGLVPRDRSRAECPLGDWSCPSVRLIVRSSRRDSLSGVAHRVSEERRHALRTPLARALAGLVRREAVENEAAGIEENRPVPRGGACTPARPPGIDAVPRR